MNTLVKEYRGEVLENIHEGILCVIDQRRNILLSVGDVENTPIYYRSAMKPIQAIPVFETDLIEKYQLTGEEAALFCASQRGEIYHQEALMKLSEKLGFSEGDLICGDSYPLNEEPKIQYICAGKSKRRLMHNCAGKHLGFMAYAREKDFSIKGYEKINHPLQIQIKQDVSELSEYPIEKIIESTDGCGVPVYAVPVKNMALSYLKLADPQMVSNQIKKNAIKKVSDTMQKYPKIIASHDFICTALLEDKNIIAKGGAQGVYCLALKEEKISIALKVMSGTELLWPIIVSEVLKKLNYKNSDTIKRLENLKSNVITNDAGEEIGKTVVQLQ